MAPYFLLVQRERGPKTPYATLDLARSEAARIQAKRGGILRISILETVEVIEPTAPRKKTGKTYPVPEHSRSTPENSGSTPGKCKPVVIFKKKRNLECGAT